MQKTVPCGHDDEYQGFIKFRILRDWVRHHYFSRRTVVWGGRELVKYQYLVYFKGKKEIFTIRLYFHLLNALRLQDQS
jgi:hypothetical protein